MMDSPRYSRLLSYAICELTMPVKRHVYNFATNYQSSLNHQLISAAAKAAKRAKSTLKTRKRLKSRLSKLKLKHNNSCNGGLDTSSKHASQNGIVFNPSSSTPEVIHEKNVMLKNADFKNKTTNAAEHSEFIENLTSSDITDEKEDGRTLVAIENSLPVDNDGECMLTTTGSSPQNGINHNDLVLIEEIHTEPSDEISGLYSDPLLLCSDQDFMISFRMNRTSFEKLLKFIAKDELEPIENIPLYKKVLIVLWLMGSSASYTDAAGVFSVTEEAAANCFFDVCATLYNGSDGAIKWPGSTEGAEIATRIEEQFGFPGVVGVLGCHYFSIAIPKDAFSRKDHFNASLRTYCISLQIVCDDRLIIRDIFPGLPGGKPTQCVLRESPLCEQLMSKDPAQRLVDPQKHILARCDYPQLPSMLTPYIVQKEGGLNKEELDFNNLHESVCTLVDQTFHMLEARFPTLRLLDPEVATMVLVAACVIHNICMENDDIFEPE